MVFLDISIKTIITCILCALSVAFATYACREIYITSIQEEEDSIYVAEQQTKAMDRTLTNEIYYNKIPATTSTTNTSNS